MYSPKIDEALIPPLYRLARARRQPMTRVVSEILAAYLISHGTLTGRAPAEPSADTLATHGWALLDEPPAAG